MLTRLQPPKFRQPKIAEADWDNFRGGLNTLLRQNEINKNELAQADNLMLIGLGVPTKRWGTQDYFLSQATGTGLGLFGAKSASGTVEVLALTDWGILTKRSNASYTQITGASWPSGYPVEIAQLNDNVYIVGEQRELVRYDFSSLNAFATLAIPTGLSASNFSGATGSTTYSWRVTATSQVGETLGSTAISFASLPQDLSDTMVRLQWTPVSAASGVLTGYNIYRGSPGDETWLAGVGDDTTIYFDRGDPASELRTLPTADTTGGPRAKYIIRYQDRLIMAGIPNEPTKVLISGRVPNQERFEWTGGGGYVLIGPDEGEDITGLGVHQGKIIVTKENSIYELTLGTVDVANFTILEPSYQLITAAQGCSSHRSIVAVDNDLLFCNKRGIHVLGFEPQILNTLRVNELSAKVRPFFENLSASDIENSSAAYFKNLYLLSFPTARKTIVFDRERIAFMGPWTTSFSIKKMLRHTDSSGIERLLALDGNDAFISEFSDSKRDDKGTAFRTIFRSRKEDFKDWTLFKTINEIYFNFRNIFGTATVNIYLEERTGQTVSGANFEITSQTGRSGWGTDQWGLFQWGLTTPDAEATSDELIRRSLLYKTGRTVQVEIITDANQDSYELLGVKVFAVPMGRGTVPSDWTI